MYKLMFGFLLSLALAACSEKNSDPTTSNPQQDVNTTWKIKFPALWSVAYASEINPEDITYGQFVNDVAEKLKADSIFTTQVKGDVGEQGLVGSVGTQGIQGVAGQDGADAVLPTWEAMYTFGSGDAFFYSCSDSSPCSAADITYYKATIGSVTEHFYAASPGAGPVVGADLLNSGEPITNIRAEHDCEYKAELLTNSVSYVLIPSEIYNGSIIFTTQSAFSSEFNVSIGDVATPLTPSLLISKRLPGSFSGTQAEKDRIAEELTTVGTHLGYQVILKRRCR